MPQVITSVSISARPEKELPVRFTLHRENEASPVMVILGDCEVYIHLSVADAERIVDTLREAVLELMKVPVIMERTLGGDY